MQSLLCLCLCLCEQSLLHLVVQLVLLVAALAVRAAACVSMWHKKQGLGSQASQLMLPHPAQRLLLAMQQALSLLLRAAAVALAGC